MFAMWSASAGTALAISGMLSLASPFVSHPAQPQPIVQQIRAAAPAPATLSYRHRITPSERFLAANVTHDGKLTLLQATQANWVRVVRHFDEIDIGDNGAVTEAQIRAFDAASRHHRAELNS